MKTVKQIVTTLKTYIRRKKNADGIVFSWYISEYVIHDVFIFFNVFPRYLPKFEHIAPPPAYTTWLHYINFDGVQRLEVQRPSKQQNRQKNHIS